MQLRFPMAIGGAILLLATVSAAAVDTEFMYQGELKQSGGLANGSFPMVFSLWDAESGGTQIGGDILIDPVVVTNGLFSVELDYGADAFSDSNRWLQVIVDGFTLDPRQHLTASPFSIRTRGIIVGDDGNVAFNSLSAVEGTVTMSSIGGIDVIIDADTNNAGEDQNARVVMKQDGGQVVGRVGYREGANKLEIMQEYADDLILGANNLDHVIIRPNGFVGIGRSTPVTGAEVFGVYSDASGFGGMYIQTAGDADAPFYGYSAGGDVDAYHYFSGGANGWLLNVGGNRMKVDKTTGDINFYGDVIFAPGTTPPFAYGRIADDGTIISGSPNVLSCTVDSTGRMNVQIAGVLPTDVIVATVRDANPRFITYLAFVDSIQFVIRLSNGNTDPNDFSFVVYRPQ